MLNDKIIAKILKYQKIFSENEFERILVESHNSNTTLEEYILSKKYLSEESLYEAAASFYKLPFINLKNLSIRKDLLFLIPENIAQTHKIIAFDQDDNCVKIAVVDPENYQIFEFLQKKLNKKMIVNLSSPTNISEAIKQYHKSLKSEFSKMEKEKTTDKSEKKEKGKEKKLAELATDLPVIRVVDTLLEYAIFENASDIHIEPEEKEVNIRYRIDGVLRSVMTLPKNIHTGITARIKILAKLKVDEHRLPQDGRFKIQSDEYKVAFRVSIIPTFYGEKTVLRLLNESSESLSLEQLGFNQNALKTVKKNISKPHGIIFVTGPTGSGKTTTLYTIMNTIKSPKINISTIEDPIEYKMDHINQCQVNPKVGFTFAGGLRAFLRQDPDVIMVGEIRDNETAEIAIHSALTGHLVLSTLHTNDAITTLPRMTEMSVPSFLVASTANLVVAQRLVRKICVNCIQSYNLKKEDIENLGKQLNMDNLLNKLESEGAILSADQPIEEMLFYRGKGCNKCNNEGYKGRLGIYEVLDVTKEIQSLIMKNATAEEIMKAAVKQGMATILEDGFIKAKNGITTIEEILRVTKE